jgi:tetratricopeptide (TPR) repeat protein
MWSGDVGANDLADRFVSALWPYWLARGHIAEGLRHLEEALARSADPQPRIRLGHCALRHLAGHESRAVLADLRAVLNVCEATGDDYSVTQAWNLIGRLEASALGNVTRGEEAWARALEYAERRGYRAERAESMGWLMVQSVFGPLPTDQGIERCERFFASGNDPKVRAFAQVERAVLEAMRGHFGVARELLAAGTQAFRELGLNVWAANNGQEAFYVEMLADRPDRAATVLSESYDALREMGERGFLSTIAAFLAHALVAEGKYEEADRFSRLSEEAAASDDIFSQVLWRTARAKVDAARGEGVAAERLARAAVDLADAQPDQVVGQADAYSDLAEVLVVLGRAAEARECLEEAAMRHHRKGNLVALRRVRERAADLAAADRTAPGRHPGIRS